MVSITGLAFGIAVWKLVSGQVRRQAEREVAAQTAEAIGRISTIDQLSRAQVESAMRLLQDASRLKGEPSIMGETVIGGKKVPDLRLGKESQVLSFGMVDRVKEIAGGTATLFAWNGSEFIRVTTNVLKPDGSRAVGTVLDARGKAFAALSKGQAYRGVVDILGVPYTTQYVPMMDGAGRLVGAWYTGFRLDSIATLGQSIEEAIILDHGFVALLKPTGMVVFHGKGISADALEELREDPKGWVLSEQIYPAWGYTVLAAYPTADISNRLLQTLGMLAGGLLILVSLVVILEFVLLKRQVLEPVRNLSARLANADLNTLIETESRDEIGELSTQFNEFVLRVRETLLKVRDSSAATAGKSSEIRSIGNSAMLRMLAQQSEAAQASAAVEQLSRGMATISSHTLDASGQARTAADAARQGASTVLAAVAQIQALSEDTQQSAGRISTLSDRTKQISSIVGVIEEIAQGTNLLALNASIEAARAGEHGRGFAVVAGEVRRLSERTAQATREVGRLVSGIESETEETANGIRSACKRAVEGAEAVSGLNDTFDHIARLVIEVDGRVDQIAKAATEETTASRQVSDTIIRVAISAREGVEGTERVLAAASDLETTSGALEALVAEFRLHALEGNRSAGTRSTVGH